MAGFVTKKVAKHVLQENAENRFGTDDPYFEHVAAVDMNGRATGKYEKRKRAIPPGLTKQEEKVLKKVTRRAYRLDNCMNFCGIRVGWSTIIGLIPAAGDIIDALMAFMVVWTCTQADIPAALKSRMILNIAMDFAVGLVPLLGDIADAFFRANTRNAALLWKHLQERGRLRLEEQGQAGNPELRGSSQKRTGRSPGRNMQELGPHSNRSQSEGRGRAAVPVKEQAMPQESRPQSSQRGGGVQPSQPIQDDGHGKGWRSWMSGGPPRTTATADNRDVENGEYAR